MRHLQTLDTKKSRGNGKAQICALRYRPGMEVPGAASHMQEAQAGNRIGRIGSRGVAVITRTAQEWEVKA